MLRLGLDIDGVLYSWHTYVYEFCIQNNIVKNVDEETFWISFDRLLGKMTIKNLINTTHLYTCGGPDEWVLETLNKLKDEYELYYITKRPPFLEFNTRRWLDKYSFPYSENLFITQDRKELLITELEIDYHVDDQNYDIKNYTNMILFERTYNKKYLDEFPNRINNIKQLPIILERMRENEISRCY